MKILVDKMPKEKHDCPYCKGFENPSPHSRDFSHELGDARSL